MDPFNKDTNTSTNPIASAPTTPAPTIPTANFSAPPSTTPVVDSAAQFANNAVPPMTTTPPAMGMNTVQTGHVEKSSKLLYAFIGVLLLILIALIGLFFYNQLSDATTAENEINVPTTLPQASPTVVVPTYASEEETEVMGVDVGAVDSQLQIIEKDINQL